jgi:glyoxylase-like metal-dependent hydrolase (beta-lactamase superfamily II)
MNDATPSARFGPVTVYFGEKTGKYPDGNMVVVRGRDATAVFDTPQVANRLPHVLAEADLAIQGHVHEDHMAGLHLLPGKPVWVHEADLDAARSWAGLSRHYGYPQPILDALHGKIRREFHYAPRPDALPYADGQVWDLGGVQVRAIHLPGHTAGHCVLLVEPVGVAFIGDFDLSSFGPYYGDATSSLADFRRSLQRLADLPATVWVTSHHKGAIDDRATFDTLLQAFVARLDEREARLLQLLQPGPQTLEALVRQRVVYPPAATDLWVDCAEQYSINRHLQELLADGRVRAQGDGHYALAGA